MSVAARRARAAPPEPPAASNMRVGECPVNRYFRATYTETLGKADTAAGLTLSAAVRIGYGRGHPSRFVVLRSYDQNRAVGVADHGVGDPAHKGSPDAPKTPAADNHQAGVYLFG